METKQEKQSRQTKTFPGILNTANLGIRLLDGIGYVFGTFWGNLGFSPWGFFCATDRNAHMERSERGLPSKMQILMKFPAPCAKSDGIFLGLTNCARDLTRHVYLCARDWVFLGVCGLWLAA